MFMPQAEQKSDLFAPCNYPPLSPSPLGYAKRQNNLKSQQLTRAASLRSPATKSLPSHLLLWADFQWRGEQSECSFKTSSRKGFSILASQQFYACELSFN